MMLHVQSEHESKESVASANSFSDRDSTSDQELESPRKTVKRQSRQPTRPKPQGPPRKFSSMLSAS